jgi:hypothetical protein
VGKVSNQKGGNQALEPEENKSAKTLWTVNLISFTKSTHEFEGQGN